MMRKFSVLLATALLVAACGTSNMGNGVNGGGAAMMMSDNDIAGIVTAANQGEIDQGNAASSRATAAEVRAFAQMMVTDHTNALNTARDLFTRRGMTPNMGDATASQLTTGSQQAVSNLGTYTGAAFDRTYMQSQVDLHQWLLSQLDATLIPSAHNRDLRQLLMTQRTAVAAHLDRARQIMAGLR